MITISPVRYTLEPLNIRDDIEILIEPKDKAFTVRTSRRRHKVILAQTLRDGLPLSVWVERAAYAKAEGYQRIRGKSAVENK
jgi:hypothetical protein